MDEILGVIIARGGSKGLPGKNLRPLRGVPLIVYTIRAAHESKLLSNFVVSTDDPKIAEVARSYGADVPFLRPTDLATDEASPWEVVRHAVRVWEDRARQQVGAAVLLQPTAPLRTAEDIDACIERFQDLDADICATAARSHNSPYFNMVEITPDSAPFARPCSSFMRDHLRRQDAPPVYALNGAVFVVRRSILMTLENQFRVERFAMVEIARRRSLDIDSAEDLKLAEWLLSGKAAF